MRKHVFIADLQPGPVAACYLVREARLGQTTRGDHYLNLTLQDRTGELPAKIWSVAADILEYIHPGVALDFEGRVELYRGKQQVIIAEWGALKPDAAMMELLSNAPQLDVDRLEEQVREFLAPIADPWLQQLRDAYLGDADFMARLREWPAAKAHHHPYQHGLLEHVVSVLGIGQALCDHYEWLDRDIVMLGLFLHDSGKLVELVGQPAPGYSVEGQLLGHITIGVCMLDAKSRSIEGFPDHRRVQLQHIILSHHESAEYGSPKPPMFPEAQIIHSIEMLDAKINAMQRECGKAPDQTDATGGLRFSRLMERHLYSPPRVDSE